MKITEKELDEIEIVSYLISEENYFGDRMKQRREIRKQILENEKKLEQFLNMIYHAECGRLSEDWIKQGREILQGK